MFGEQALIFNRSRAAHCIVVSNICDLCVMHKADYRVIMKDFHRNEEEKRKAFLENKILSDPEMRSLARIIGVNFTKRHYFKNKLLFKKGDRPDKLYLVYTGQILIWDNKLVNSDEEPGGRAANNPASRHKLPLQLDFSKSKVNRYDLMLSGPGKMVGEEELFTGVRRRYNAIVESECVVYEIEFERMINVCLDNHFVRKMLTQKIHEKQSMVDRIMEIKVKADIACRQVTADACRLTAFKINEQAHLEMATEREGRLDNCDSPELKMPTILLEELEQRSLQFRRHSQPVFAERRSHLPNTHSLMTTTISHKTTAANTNPAKSTNKANLQSILNRAKINGVSLNPRFKSFKRIKSIGIVSTKDSKYRMPSIIRDEDNSVDKGSDFDGESIITKRIQNYPSQRIASQEDMNSGSMIHSTIMSNKDQLLRKIMKDTSHQMQWTCHRSKNKLLKPVGIRSVKHLQSGLEFQSPFIGSYSKLSEPVNLTDAGVEVFQISSPRAEPFRGWESHRNTLDMGLDQTNIYKRATTKKPTLIRYPQMPFAVSHRKNPSLPASQPAHLRISDYLLTENVNSSADFRRRVGSIA